MKQSFNNKCKDYCRSKEAKEEIIRMTLGHDESLEDYEERFQLNYRSAICTLAPESLKLVLLRWIKEDILETLIMMSRGEIYQLSYGEINSVVKNHSRVARKKGRAREGLINSSPSTTSIKK